jgi:APA family basic amino acid/polyamine antiporter
MAHRLGTLDASMLVVGSMIGSGIFIVSAESSQLMRSAAGLLLVWILAGVMTVLGAINTAELATLFPRAGGPFVYFREAYGDRVAFLFAWATFVVVQSGTIAAVAAAFAKFLGVFVPQIGPPILDKLVALGVIVVLTFANARGLRTGTAIQNLLTLIKYAALLGLTIGGLLWMAPPGWSTLPAAEFSEPANQPWLLLLAAAMAGPLFSQSAWTNVTFPAGEIDNPSRVLPRALIAGCLAVSVLYVLTNVGYLRLLGVGGIAAAPQGRVGSAALEVMLPGIGSQLMAAAILISTFGCVNGLILSGARVVSAASQAGMFFPAFATNNSRGVPALALWIQALWCAVLALSGSYSQLLRYVLSAELLIYVLLVGAVVVLRRSRPAVIRPFRAWGYPVSTVVYVLMTGTLAVLLTVARPTESLIGYGLVLLGVFVFRLVPRPRA